MGPHGSSWGFMGFHGPSWVCMGFHGFSGVFRWYHVMFCFLKIKQHLCLENKMHFDFENLWTEEPRFEFKNCGLKRLHFFKIIGFSSPKFCEYKVGSPVQNFWNSKLGCSIHRCWTIKLNPPVHNFAFQILQTRNFKAQDRTLQPIFFYSKVGPSRP